MTLRWFGGKAVALEVKARGEEPLRLFVYPDSRTTKLRSTLPPSRAWITSSKEVPEGTFHIDGPGEYEITPFAVTVLSIRKDAAGEELWAVVVRADDCSFALLDAHSASALKADMLEALGDVQVLAISLGDGGKAADRDRALKALGAVQLIEPKVFVPLAGDSLLPRVLQELGIAKQIPKTPSFVYRPSQLPQEGMDIALLTAGS